MKFQSAFIDYTKPFEIDDDITFQGIRYDNGPLIIKDSCVYVPFEVSKFGSVTLTVDKKSEMFTILKTLEKTLRITIMKMPADEKYNPTINVKIGDIKDIPVKSTMSCEIQVTGIWKNADTNKKGVSLKLVKIGASEKPKRELESFKSIL